MALDSWSRRFWSIGAVGIAVWISADLSRFLTVPSNHDTSAVWPPIGIALASFFILGRPWLLVYPLVIGAWFGVQGYEPTIAVAFAVEQGIELWAMQALYRRFVRQPDMLSSLDGALRFYLAIPVAALLLPAGLLALIYYQFGYFARQPFVAVWLFQWLPEALGVVLFAPPLKRLADWYRRGQRPTVSGQTLVFFALFGAILVASVGLAAVGKYNYARGLDYLFFPLLTAMALAGCVHTALVTLPVAVVCTLLSIYLGSWTSPHHAWGALGEALTFAGGLAVITQLVIATTIERTHLIDSLRHANYRDPMTGEFNRFGLVAYVERTRTRPQDKLICLTLCLRNFIHARELLPLALVRRCENWIVLQIREQLRPVTRWLTLGRLDQGVYSAVVACHDIDDVERAIHDLTARIRNEIFDTDGWTYRADATVGAMVFRAADAVEDVITASRYKALKIQQLSYQPVYFDNDYQLLLADQRADFYRLEQIKNALEQDRFILFGQEIQPAHATNGQAKLECLLRMLDDDDTLLSPAVFLPLAHRFGYMPDIDRWVVHRAFTQIARHPELSRCFSQFSINLSGASLNQSSLASFIEDEILQVGLPASRFCFEITETEAIDNWDHALVILRQLKQIGFTLALDDFGSGLASFDYLNRFDFDSLKIDGSFVRTLDTASDNNAIVQAIVLVAQQRRIQTVAEFVENEAIVDKLKDFNVDYMQGFGLHRPVPLDQIVPKTASHSAD